MRLLELIQTPLCLLQEVFGPEVQLPITCDMVLNVGGVPRLVWPPRLYIHSYTPGCLYGIYTGFSLHIYTGFQMGRGYQWPPE